MINTAELKAELVKHSMTQEELAFEIGLDPSTLNRKINNKSAVFTVAEAQNIAKVLGLSREKCADIFFAVELA